MRALKISTHLYGVLILSLVITEAACQQAPVATTNANVTNTGNANTQVAANTSASPAATDMGSTIETREPEKYQATLVVTAETTGGERSVAIPPLSVEVARNGADRRYAFKLPTGEQVIYLDRADKRYIIAPGRKQYAELTPEVTGFEVPRTMTPGQIVAQLQKQPGYERVGEEQMNGRTVVKYRFVGTARTGTQAGDVKSETFVFIDKETGLPLRSEMFGEATGNVQGVKSGRIVAELRDIQQDVAPTLFEVPTDMRKVTPEEVRQQVNLLVSIAGALLKNLTAQSNAPATATSPSPATTASPTAR